MDTARPRATVKREQRDVIYQFRFLFPDDLNKPERTVIEQHLAIS